MYANAPKKADACQRILPLVAPAARTNQQWLDELRGHCSVEGQEHAHADLANFLYRIAMSYLHRRCADVPLLSVLTDSELAQFAHDFVQETLEKLTRDRFALLEKFSGRGGFLAWITQVIYHHIASELRLAAWRTRHALPCDDALAHVAANSPAPERALMIAYIGELLCAALAQLPVRYHIAFCERIIEGRSAAEVGEMLGVSANAVNVLVHRSKIKLRQYLAQAGVSKEVLELFE